MGGRDTKTAVTRNAEEDKVEGQTELKLMSTDQVHNDIGLSYFLQSQQMDPYERAVISRRVLRKIDFTILPAMCFIYLLSFLDKQTLNYASAYGLNEDLGLSGNQYSWVAATTNIGYLLFAYPSSLCLQRFPIGKFIPTVIILWGIMLISTVGAKNFAGIMALRFLLGGLESGIAPAWMLITGMFWTRDEQPLRMCIWLGSNGIALMLGSGISWGLGHADTSHLESWQLIFLCIGVVTVVVGVLAMFLFPSTPLDFKLFSHQEKVVSVWRVSENQTGIKHDKILPYQIKEAFLEPRVWFIAMQQLSIGIINASITNFMSALLSGFGYGPLETVLWQLPNGAFQLVCTVAAGLFASSIQNTSVLTAIAVQLPSLAGIIGIAIIPIQHRLALTACCWLLGILGAAIVLNWAIITANIAGHSKRMTVNGINFVCYAGGNVIGPFIFEPAEAPRYMTAIKALCGVYASSLFFTALIGLWMLWENKKRDRQGISDSAGVDTDADSDGHGFEDGFLDRTDRENRAFRYKL